MLKRFLIGGGLLLVVLVGAGVYWIGGPRFVIGLLTYGRQAREGDLAIGDRAPSVSLVALDGSTRDLGDWVGPRPLVLVFGSFT